MSHQSPQNSQGGYIAVVTILILMMLLGTGLAYLKWSADESVEFKRQHAALQAYYLAQSVISQDVIPHLCSIRNMKIPIITRNGSAASVAYDMPENMDGKWKWVGDYDEFESKDTTIAGAYIGKNVFYGAQVTGMVEYTAHNRYDSERKVKVDTSLYIQFNSAETWAIYMYLSNHEVTHHIGDRIKFMNGDILYNWVHSNDQIAIMQDPIFYSLVTSCASSFWRGTPYAPQFLGPLPVFNADSIPFYTQLNDLRMAAGVYSREGYNFAVVLRGANGYDFVEWPMWSSVEYQPMNPQNIIQRRPVPDEGAVFVDGDLFVTGVVAGNDLGAAGRMSIGCSGNMWLLDNIRYINSSPVNGEIYDQTRENPNMLGLMSESNVLIMNTWANGKCNGRYRTNNNPDSSSIILNGGIIALGDCFSFADQNDDPNNPGAYPPNLPEWYFSMPPGPNGPPPYNQTLDERGTIYLWGQISQNKRGYVHRSNFGGTGYLKDYHYDLRFKQFPPPYYPRLDESIKGSGRRIVAWGAGPVPREIVAEE